MAISADISTPIDDTKGGTFSWGKFQQDKKSQVLIYVTVPEGTRGKQVKVCATPFARSSGARIIFFRVRVPRPRLTRACTRRRAQVTINTKSLKVVALSQEIMSGPLFAPVVSDECTWEMSDGKVLITLEKQEEGWWDRVLTNDEAIDTTTFDHDPFMLGDMDDLKHNSMRSMVSRMLGSDDPTEGKAPTLDPLQD